MKACILDYASLAASDLKLDELWELPIQWQLYDSTASDQTAERIADCEIVLSNKVVLDKSLLQANPQIKLVIILATGTNNVDLLAAKELGISVCNIANYSTESVVQQTFAMMLALQTHLLQYQQSVVQGQWAKSQFFGLLDFPIHEISGKTLGIIGYGAIGQRVAEVAKAFGMHVLVAQSLSGEAKADRVSLEQLLAQSDVLSIHCPLTQESNNLIGKAQLDLMKPTALLLNLGRGGIVNEQDLLNALQQGVIKAAALDVLAQEPPELDNPLISAQLPNLLITPHTAWASVQARQTLLDQVQTILHSFKQNKPLINQVA